MRPFRPVCTAPAIFSSSAPVGHGVFWSVFIWRAVSKPNAKAYGARTLFTRDSTRSETTGLLDGNVVSAVRERNAPLDGPFSKRGFPSGPAIRAKSRRVRHGHVRTPLSAHHGVAVVGRQGSARPRELTRSRQRPCPRRLFPIWSESLARARSRRRISRLRCRHASARPGSVFANHLNGKAFVRRIRGSRSLAWSRYRVGCLVVRARSVQLSSRVD